MPSNPVQLSSKSEFSLPFIDTCLSPPASLFVPLEYTSPGVFNAAARDAVSRGSHCLDRSFGALAYIRAAAVRGDAGHLPLAPHVLPHLSLVLELARGTPAVW